MEFDEYVRTHAQSQVVVRGTIVPNLEQPGLTTVTLVAFTNVPHGLGILWYTSTGPVPTSVCANTNVQLHKPNDWPEMIQQTPTEFMDANWPVRWWYNKKQIVIARPIDNSWRGRWEEVGKANIVMMMHLPHLLGYLKNNEKSATVAMFFARRFASLLRDLYDQAWLPTR